MKWAIAIAISFVLYAGFDGGIESAIAGTVCAGIFLYWLRDYIK